MYVEFNTILSQNVTFVYDSLEPRYIDSGRLKKLLGPNATPTIMDTPEMIVVVYPPKPTIVQIGDRRIRITVPEASDEIGEPPIWEYAYKLSKLVPKSEVNMIAYGFNYDLEFEASQIGSQTAILNKFLRNPKDVADTLGGELDSFVPRFKFKKNTVQYDILVETISELRIKVHLNVHFDLLNNPLPTRKTLRTEFFSEYEHLIATSQELLQFGGIE